MIEKQMKKASNIINLFLELFKMNSPAPGKRQRQYAQTAETQILLITRK